MSALHAAIEKAIKDHCEGGDLWLCAHIASEPFDAMLAERDARIADLEAVAHHAQTVVKVCERDYKDRLQIANAARERAEAELARLRVQYPASLAPQYPPFSTYVSGTTEPMPAKEAK